MGCPPAGRPEVRPINLKSIGWTRETETALCCDYVSSAMPIEGSVRVLNRGSLLSTLPILQAPDHTPHSPYDKANSRIDHFRPLHRFERRIDARIIPQTSDPARGDTLFLEVAAASLHPGASRAEQAQLGVSNCGPIVVQL
eukprot:8462191-Pyramimonas_sp.AAC.3